MGAVTNDHAVPPFGGSLRLGEFHLVPGELRTLRRSGWVGFSLLLADESGTVSKGPVVQGIHSRGGKDGIRPWMDIEYSGEVAVPCADAPGRIVSLAEGGLDRRLFRILGEAVPPGGHLMVSYEDEQAIHRETMRSLEHGVPAAATPLGSLLFLGGFTLVKNWYLSEGGMEGPRKLWGEKAPDPDWERTFRERTLRELRGLLARDTPRGTDPVLAAARARAAYLLGHPDNEPL